MASFKLEVMTPSKRFYSGEVEHIIVTTQDGKEGFMADHEWTCKLLDAGQLRINTLWKQYMMPNRLHEANSPIHYHTKRQL